MEGEELVFECGPAACHGAALHEFTAGGACAKGPLSRWNNIHRHMHKYYSYTASRSWLRVMDAEELFLSCSNVTLGQYRITALQWGSREQLDALSPLLYLGLSYSLPRKGHGRTCPRGFT